MKQLCMTLLLIVGILGCRENNPPKQAAIPATAFTEEEVQILKQWTESEMMREMGRPHKGGAF